jgi:hypothetical protein
MTSRSRSRSPLISPNPETGAGVEVTGKLAGHADIRTTTVYTAVDGDRRLAAVQAAERSGRGLGRPAR